MLKLDTIEDLLNKEKDLNDNGLHLVEQGIVVGIINMIDKNEFNSFGEVMSYKLEKRYLNQKSKTFIEEQYGCYEIFFLVLKTNKEYFIYEIDGMKENMPEMKISKTLGYVHKSALYIPSYKRIQGFNFEKNIANTRFIFTNKEYFNFLKDLYVLTYDIFKKVSKKEDFLNNAENFSRNSFKYTTDKAVENLLKEYEGILDKDKEEITIGEKGIKKILDIFDDKNKNALIREVEKSCVNTTYKAVTLNMIEYVKDRKTYLMKFRRKNLDKIVQVLENQYGDRLDRIGVIKNNLDVVKVWELNNVLNSEMKKYYEIIEDVLLKTKSKTVTVRYNKNNSEVKIKPSLCLSVQFGLYKNTMYRFFRIKSKKSTSNTYNYNLMSINKIEPFDIVYRGKVLWSFSLDDVQKIQKIALQIENSDVVITR